MNISTLNIIQLFFIVSLFIVMFILLKHNIAIKHERRISRYSIEPVNNKFSSLFDGVKNWYDNLIRKLRGHLSKSGIIKILSKKYEKYVVYGEEKTAIDYVINKLLISLAFVLLVIFSNVLSGKIISFWLILIFLILGYFILDVYWIFLRLRKIMLIKSQMLRAIIIMNNAFKSGKSTLQAVEIASKELGEPINHEFEKMYKDMKYGLSVDTVFERFSKRIDIEEVRYVSSSLTVLNKTGGNIVKVFSSIEKNLFDKKKFKEELKSSTSSSFFMVILLIFMPIIIVWIIDKLNPRYFLPLFSSMLGYILIILIGTIFVLYVFSLIKILIKVIMKAKV